MDARGNANIHDTKLGIPITPEVTNCWDNGRVMLDGRIACQIPDMFAQEFGGLEIELNESDFPNINEM